MKIEESKRRQKTMFKRHENVLQKTYSESLTSQDFVKKEGSYISVRKPARVKLPPKENFDLKKMIDAGVDLKKVDCRILEPKTMDLRPRKTTTKTDQTATKTQQTELNTED